MSMQTPQELSARFAIPGRVTFEAGKGGLTKATISADGSNAEIYLHGGHVTQFVPSGGKPLLFTSAESLYQTDKPIRGGVPLIFPWFARLSEWTVETTPQDGRSTTLVLRLETSAATRALWPGEFELRYTITVAEKLTLELSVRNVGSEAFVFEEALHTYLSVADVRQISIEGLAGVTFIDKVDQLTQKVQNGAIQITGETDRVYLATKSTCTLNDSANARRIVVSKTNSDATVVWNPWIAKAKAMADFGDEEWTKMVCVETCNVNVHAVKLAAGESHVMSAAIGEER
jgi:D-hexose-6-phosphate mutarotase